MKKAFPYDASPKRGGGPPPQAVVERSNRAENEVFTCKF